MFVVERISVCVLLWFDLDATGSWYERSPNHFYFCWNIVRAVDAFISLFLCFFALLLFYFDLLCLILFRWNAVQLLLCLLLLLFQFIFLLCFKLIAEPIFTFVDSDEKYMDSHTESTSIPIILSQIRTKNEFITKSMRRVCVYVYLLCCLCMIFFHLSLPLPLVNCLYRLGEASMPCLR